MAGLTQSGNLQAVFVETIKNGRLQQWMGYGTCAVCKSLYFRMSLNLNKLEDQDKFATRVTLIVPYAMKSEATSAWLGGPLVL